MMGRSNHNLRRELRLAGASEVEARELAALAVDLRRLRPATRHHSRWTTILPFGLTSLAGLALGMMLVIFSQTAVAGSWLYPVQKLSDSVAILIHPDYRGAVMMKRAQQVKQLVATHASSQLVLATLASYQTEAIAYKSTSDDYSMFEYCKASLQQAAAIAPTPERQAIEAALVSLKSV